VGRAAPPEPMDVLAGVPSAFDAGRQGQGPDADAQVIGRQQKRKLPSLVAADERAMQHARARLRLMKEHLSTQCAVRLGDLGRGACRWPRRGIISSKSGFLDVELSAAGVIARCDRAP